MSTTDARGHVVPSGTDAPARAGLLAMMASVNDIVVVADKTARATLAAAVSPTTSRPLFTWRKDADADRALEVTTDGSTWQCVTMGSPRIYTTSLSITVVTANTPVTAAVTFPSGFFGATPTVMTSTGSVNVATVGPTGSSGASSTGVTVSATKAAAGAVPVVVTAIGPAPVTS